MSLTNNRVSHSAASSVAALFSTVTTTAHAVTTGVNALGNLAEELNLRSEERLHNVRQDIAHDRIHTDVTRRNDHALRLARSLAETQKELERDAAIKAHYTTALQAFAKLDAAQQPQSQSNSNSQS